VRIVPLLASTAAATALVVAGLASPAGAATQNRTDAADDAGEPFGPASPGVLASADIRTLKGVHGADTLTFTFTVADLITPDLFTAVDATVRLQTPGGTDYRAALTAFQGQKFLSLSKTGTSSDVACGGLVGRVLPAKDQLVVGVPRSCVRNPRTVLFGGVTSTSSGIGSDSSTAVDDARRDGGDDLEEIRLGTRPLARG